MTDEGEVRPQAVRGCYVHVAAVEEKIGMIDAIRDIILVGSGMLVLLMLNRMKTRAKPVPIQVWPFLLSGFVLLLLGRTLEMTDPTLLPVPYVIKAFTQEVLGFCLGFIMLSVGLFRWIPDVLGQTRPEKPKRSARAPRPGAPAGEQIVAMPVSKNASSEHSANELLGSILKSSLAGVMVLKAVRDEAGDVMDFECRLMNGSAEQILGRSGTSFVGKHVLSELPCIKEEVSLAEAVSVIDTGLPFKAERHFTHGTTGAWYQFCAVKMGDGLAVTFNDVSARKRAEAQLRHAAHHDTLTGLPNRALFIERLQQALNRSNRFPDYKFAVLFLDFDRFKIINDSLGHEAGDQLLMAIADRMRANLRSVDLPSRVGDGHLPARLGGDEFVVLLDSINTVRDAVRVAERLQIELGAPHTLDGHEVISTASIGIVSSELGYETPDDIIRDADTAMYRAKTEGKARHVVFDEKMHQEVVDRLRLEQELREAVEKSAFQLQFEPVADLESGALAGFEALVRWPHEAQGTIQPANFIGLAEEIGLIVPIGEWVIKEACRQLKTWQEQHPSQADLSMSINLARAHLLHPDLIPQLTATLEETGVDPGCIRLELVEDMVLDEQTGVRDVLDKIRAMGVQLVMDDFGTGHSSLSSLHRFPINVVKIDRDFMNNTTSRRDYGAIVQAIVELAHNLDIQVVAEGIETADQLALLQALNCDFAQGFLFSKPLDPPDVEALLQKQPAFRMAA